MQEPSMNNVDPKLLTIIKTTEAATIWPILPVTDTINLVSSALIKHDKGIVIFCYYKGDGFIVPMGVLYNLIKPADYPNDNNGSYELHFKNIKGMIGFDEFKITITKKNIAERIKYIVLSDDNTDLIQKLQSQQNNTPPNPSMVSRLFGKRNAKVRDTTGGQKKHKTIRKHKNKRKTVRHKK